MGRLTDDMTRLVGEIHTGRADRARTIREVKHVTAEMKRAVAEMQAGFRSARADMVRRQRRMLQGFVSGLRGTVGGLRNEFAADLAGAHRAWVSTAVAAAAAMPGRSRRGGKWFGGESA
jgi:hypothetical protein